MTTPTIGELHTAVVGNQQNIADLTKKINHNIEYAAFRGVDYGNNGEGNLLIVGQGENGELRKTITMKATGSKIRLTASICYSSNDSVYSPRFRFARNGAVISDALGNSNGNRVQCTFATHYPNASRGMGVANMTYIYDPGTYTLTDNFEFSVVVSIYGNKEWYINRTSYDSADNDSVARAISTFQVEEIFQ